MRKFYFGVDGTGPYRNSKYEADFRDSFVNLFK